MRRSAILAHRPEKEDAVRALPMVSEIIRAHGELLGVVELDGELGESDCGETALSEVAGGAGSRADLVVVLGGDGTLLQASRAWGGLGVPLLGVNLGRVGFMAEFDTESLRRHAGAVFGGELLDTKTYDRLAGALYARGASSPRFSCRALNELVLTAGPPFRMITLELSVDGEEGPRVSGDGLIVSTPIGSTAYSVSAGGPIVDPRLDATLITPIAAHSLSFRPIVVSRGSRIEVAVPEANRPNGSAGTTLVVDGQVLEPVNAGDRLVVTADPMPVRFVRNPEGRYWRTVIEKMHWAAPPRARG